MTKKLLFLVLVLTVMTLASTWSWDDSTGTVIASGNLAASYFAGGAAYTCFSNPLIQDIPVIPERSFSTSLYLNRLFYVESDQAIVDSIATDWIKHLPRVATCSYQSGLNEHCYGLLASSTYNHTEANVITYRSVELSSDVNDSIEWSGGSGTLSIAMMISGSNCYTNSIAICGDSKGYIHLVASVDIFTNHEVKASLYYWRWSATTQSWDIDGESLRNIYDATTYRYPEIACDSEGDLHVVYVSNDNLSNSQHKIGYSKVSFNNLGYIESKDHSTIPVGAFNLSCAAPDIAIDDQDNLHVVYQGHLPGEDWGVFYAKYNGMFWFPNMPINEPFDSLFTWEPAITVCQDTVHVVFEYGTLSDEDTSTTASNSIGYTSKPISGGGFTYPDEVSKESAYSDAYDWDSIFIYNYHQAFGYAYHNVYPDIISEDDEVTVVWLGNTTAGYTLGQYSRILARRLLYTE